MRKYTVLGICLLCTTVIFAADDWVTTGKDLVYPPDLYFVGVGTSERGFEEAKSAAIVEIRKQISVKISATVIDEQSSFISGGIEKASNRVESRAKLSTSGEIAGVQIVKTAQNGKLYHALAILDKDNFIKTAKAQIKDLNSQLKTVVEAAKADIGASKIASGLQKIADAKKLMAKIASQKALLSGISPVTDPNHYSIAEISSMHEKCISSLKMIKVSGDNQSGEVGMVPAEPFVIKIEADAVPVSLIPVKLTYKGKKLMERITDEQGIIQFSIGELAESVAGVHPYTAEISLPVSSTVKNILASQKQTFTYTIVANPCSSRVEVVVSPSLASDRQEIVKRVLSRLEKFNIKEHSKAPTLVQVSITAKDAGGVSGLSESNSFIRTEVSAQFTVFNDENEKIDAFTGISKGMGGSIAKSAINGIENMRLDKDLKPALEKICGFASAPKLKIAVFDFKEKSQCHCWWYDIAPNLSDMIITGLINSRKYDVVERSQLNRIMEEKALGQSGAVEENEAIQIAQVAHADLILIGSYGIINGNVEADARIVDMKNGVARCGMSSSTYYRSELRSLANEIVGQIKTKCAK